MHGFVICFSDSECSPASASGPWGQGILQDSTQRFPGNFPRPPTEAQPPVSRCRDSSDSAADSGPGPRAGRASAARPGAGKFHSCYDWHPSHQNGQAGESSYWHPRAWPTGGAGALASAAADGNPASSADSDCRSRNHHRDPGLLNRASNVQVRANAILRLAQVSSRPVALSQLPPLSRLAAASESDSTWGLMRPSATLR